MKSGVAQEHEDAKKRFPRIFRQYAPLRFKRFLSRWYWRMGDARDYFIEVVGRIPSHFMRLFFYRRVFHVGIGPDTSIHRNCRFYHASAVSIGANTVINRDVVLDGRAGLRIGSNVSISEGSQIITLEHDPNSPTFDWRGNSVVIGDRVFLGTRSLVLPGNTIGEGAIIAAGAVVTKDVQPFDIVAGVPARSIGQRRQDLTYSFNYRKFLG